MARLPDKHKEILNSPAFAYFATINEDGSPQVSPVWIDHEGDHVLINTEAKRVKPKNVRRDPRVSIAVARPDNPYEWIHITGRVVEVTDKGADAHIDKLAKKYMGQDKYLFNQPGDQRVILRIEPVRATKPM
jgi:PPOX class probable F420-dependent enzyme